MPNISFDIFYNTDILNFTATRSGGAPRVKPDWKVRQAPKLAPKYKPTPESEFGRKPAQQKPKELPEGTQEVEEVEQSEAGDVPEQKKQAPKLANGSKKSTPPKLNKQSASPGGAQAAPKKAAPKLNKK